MKAVLAGKSRYMESLKPALVAAGIEPIAAETVSELKKLPSEFPVVLLYDTELSPMITEKKTAEKITAGLKPHDIIVFLMDQEQDTSPFIESQVLDMAGHLAAVKRRVAVLMRSSRASCLDFENRYRAARQKGVMFIKYEKIDVNYNSGSYHISAWDGVTTIFVNTPLCIYCEGKPSAELYEFADALRVRTYGGRNLSGGNGISGGRWFLNQGKTFKRNVRFINTDTLDGDVKKIVPSLVRDILGLAEPEQAKTAYVDSKKCAFCYTCYRICPHSALGPDENNEAMAANELLCEGCGICLAVCPARAIEWKEMSGDETEAKAMTREDTIAIQSEETRTIKQESVTGVLKVFCCENSAFIAVQEALLGLDAAIEAVPCGGEISAGMVTEALKRYERVLIAVCCEDACKHYDGNQRCIRQMELLKAKLDRLGYDPNRIRSLRTGAAMINILRDAAEKAFSEGGAI